MSETVGALLDGARAQGVERLDAQLLLAHALKQPRSWVIAHADDRLSTDQADAARTLLDRRARGAPLAYLVGVREFRGLPLTVTPDVLIPRPDTETLVDWALECLRERPKPRIVDLGTGSGAIALALKHALPQAEVHASDLSPAALAVAQGNGQRLGLAVRWHIGAWWAALPAGLRFHAVLSNPPYVAPADPHLPALAHEPLGALVPTQDTGDGLADIARIAEGAPAWLLPGGCLLVEHGAAQGAAVRGLLRDAGLAKVHTRTDLAGLERVSGGWLS